MRGRIMDNRADLVAHLSALGCAEQARSLARQKGMFSMLPLDASQMLRLRRQYAIYGTTSGRINIAGIPAHRIPCLARGIAGVLGAGSAGEAADALRTLPRQQSGPATAGAVQSQG